MFLPSDLTEEQITTAYLKALQSLDDDFNERLALDKPEHIWAKWVRRVVDGCVSPPVYHFSTLFNATRLS